MNHLKSLYFNLISYFFFLFIIGTLPAFCDAEGPKVLAVVAHPDDESYFAVTAYKIRHELEGAVDVVMITNGEGGYKYSTLSEPIYHLHLTDEKVGRTHLPFIRKREALSGGAILGIRNYIFLEEKDTGYTLDPEEVLNGIWNTARIKETISKLIEQEKYDFIFTMIPWEGTHGHHKAATLLALETVKELKDHRPIILAAKPAEKDQPIPCLSGLESYPITKTDPDPIGFVDKTQKFGYNNRLDYKIIFNWYIAEHKSQGTVQLAMNRGDYENFYNFKLNNPEDTPKILHLFDSLANARPGG
ncbi:MAG: hypothetical protein Tsb0021_15940 [Chlamydiales bacterium]